MISIDFGSRNTKVAARRDFDIASELVTHPHLNLDELHFCIPTVAAVDRRKPGELRWAFGVDAVDIVAGNGIEVFKNWKSQLFGDSIPEGKPGQPVEDLVAVALERIDNLASEREQLIRRIADHRRAHPRDVAPIVARMSMQHLRELERRSRPERLSLVLPELELDVREVTVAFFRWLRVWLTEPLTALGIDVAHTPVRLCVPDFVPETESADFIIEALEEAGWNTNGDGLLISEPWANAIGVLSRGRNATRRVRGAGPFADYGKMFAETALYKALRTRGLMRHKGASTNHATFVVDVGAYTTDFALVEFDVDEIDAPPRRHTQSEPLGIYLLDDEVRQVLTSESASRVASFDFRDLEIFHRNVYSAGRAHESQGRAIGAAQEMPKIRDCIRDFSDRIVARADAFLNGREVSKVGELVLTGGGNNIPAIQEALRQSLEKRGVRATHAPKLDKSTSVPGPYSELAQDLARGGSALGGASVLFDLEDY